MTTSVAAQLYDLSCVHTDLLFSVSLQCAKLGRKIIFLLVVICWSLVLISLVYFSQKKFEAGLIERTIILGR